MLRCGECGECGVECGVADVKVQCCRYCGKCAVRRWWSSSVQGCAGAGGAAGGGVRGVVVDCA